jgi:DNA-binding winged helix-turn-helix (wHTH) protein
MEAGQGPTAGFAFGRCRVLPQQRQLFADGAPVKLGVRAFDVLMALIETLGSAEEITVMVGLRPYRHFE